MPRRSPSPGAARSANATLSPAVAFAVAAAGIGLFSVMDAFMKSLTLVLGVYNATVWRTGTSIVPGMIAWAAAGRPKPSARSMRLHAIRAAITAVMAVLFFWGLARVPMAQAITLAYIAPILALIGGALFLGERVGRRVAIASAAAFGGVLIVLLAQPVALGREALLGSAAVLVSAVLYAGNLLVARLQAQAAGPAEIAFLQSALVTAFLLLAAPWLLAVPPMAEWWKIGCGALLATASLFLLGWAYAHGEAGYLATTEYTSFVYAATLGYLVFGERLTWPTVLGALAIVAACLFAARRRDVVQTTLEPAA
jgi:drug/metabolite transporter (DMT)-like permease